MDELELSMILAWAAYLGLGMCLVGFFRLAFEQSDTGLLRHFVLFVCGLLGTLALSIGFWDLLPMWFSLNDWRSFVADLGGKNSINMTRSTLIIFASYHGLMTLHLMTPDEGDTRARWPWWKAWLYPPRWIMVDRLRSILRCRWRK